MLREIYPILVLLPRCDCADKDPRRPAGPKDKTPETRTALRMATAKLPPSPLRSIPRREARSPAGCPLSVVCLSKV